MKYSVQWNPDTVFIGTPFTIEKISTSGFMLDQQASS